MKNFCFLILVVLIGSVSSAWAQTEEETLKEIVRMETESFMKRDSVKWQSLFLQNEKFQQTSVGNGYSWHGTGWKNYESQAMVYMRDRRPSNPYTGIDNTNYVIHASEALATVSYSQRIFVPGNTSDSLPPSGTLEYRTLVKEGSSWKISAIMTIDTLSFTSTKPADVENMFNAAGYNFLNQKKTKEAIQVFKFNTELYPESWNTYDSLGEGFAAVGDKKQAIENYEKSIQLNPKNETGKATLQKLKSN